MLNRRTPTEWVPVVNVRKRVAGSFVDCTFVRRRIGSEWVQVWPVLENFQVVLSTDLAGGVFDCDNTQVVDCPFIATVVSVPLEVTVTGGTGPITYNWQFLSGDSGIFISNPSSNTAVFQSGVGRRQTRSAQWRVSVTRGAFTVTRDFEVRLSYTYTAGGGTPNPNEVIP
jgi:hypothetical protein